MAFKRDQAKSGIVSTDEEDPELAAKMAEARAKKDEIDRQAGMQGHLHKLAVIGLYVVGSLIIVALGVWLYHYIAPTSWRFLTDQQVKDLNFILFSGFIGGLVTGQVRRLAG